MQYMRKGLIRFVCVFKTQGLAGDGAVIIYYQFSENWQPSQPATASRTRKGGLWYWMCEPHKIKESYCFCKDKMTEEVDFYVWKEKEKTGQKNEEKNPENVGGDVAYFCDYGGSDPGAGGGCG